MIDLESVMHHISEYKYPEVSKTRTTESEFTDDLIDAGNHVNKSMGIIAHLVIEKNISDKEKAILMGHMTYMYKLYDSFLYLVCDNRIEISFILLRTLSEMAVRVKYFTINMSADLCEKFIKSSLAYDKKRYDEINKRVGDNSPSAIEKRMRESIEDRFEKAGYNFSQIDFKIHKHWGKDVSQLASDLNLSTEYEFGFRTGSAAVHARWDFLERYNLNEESGNYSPNPSYATTRPHIIEAASYLVLLAAMNYLDLFPDYADKATLKGILQKGLDWFKEMSQKHEEFLAAPDGKE